jgi:adenylate kinase
MFNLILFGPPGSGKGTQAEKITEKYNLHHISTGDLFRCEMKNESDLGKAVRGYLDRGELVPDEITIKMLNKKIKSFNDPHGFLLDGFPRNSIQAESLDSLFEELNTDVDILLALDVPEEEIVSRILNRGKTSGRADDAKENIIRGRFQVYKKVTESVFTHYDKFKKAKAINGVGSIDEIFNRLSCVIDEFKK